MHPDSFTLCTIKCFTFDGFGEKEYPMKANEIPCTIGLLIPSEVFYKEQFFFFFQFLKNIPFLIGIFGSV